MLVLFDHGTPKGLIRSLPGHTVYTAQAKGWDALSNGALLNAAEEAKFEVLHTTPRQMATAGRISGTVIQALRWLGQDHVDDRVVATLHRRLSDADKRQLQLQQDLRYAPTWVADVMRTIAAPE